MVHEPTCPAGLEADRTQDRDEAWFILHPGQDSYERDTTWGERAEAETMGIALPTRVRITELRPGWRSRQFLYDGGDDHANFVSLEFEPQTRQRPYGGDAR